MTDLTVNMTIPGMVVRFMWQAILECNLDKAGIRKIEEERRSILQSVCK